MHTLYKTSANKWKSKKYALKSPSKKASKNSPQTPQGIEVNWAVKVIYCNSKFDTVVDPGGYCYPDKRARACVSVWALLPLQPRGRNVVDHDFMPHYYRGIAQSSTESSRGYITRVS